MLRSHLETMAAMSDILVQSADLLGPHPGCGLNAMLKYSLSTLHACIMDPASAVFNRSVAEATLAQARGSSGSGASPSGGSKKNRQPAANGGGNRERERSDGGDRKREHNYAYEPRKERRSS